MGLAEGDALDVGQWEAMLSEPLCKRKAGRSSGPGGQDCLAGVLGRLWVLPFTAPSQGTFCTLIPLVQAVLTASSLAKGDVTRGVPLSTFHCDIAVYKRVGTHVSCEPQVGSPPHTFTYTCLLREHSY